MFIENKYTTCYFCIIKKASERTIIPNYVEKHHILPKSFGGLNCTENIVSLTAREHFICHRLLIKMTAGKEKAKMVHALNMMTIKSNPNHKRNYHITSRIFESLKISLSEAMTDFWTDEKRKQRSESMLGERNHFYGKRHSEETKEKISSRPITAENKKKLSTGQIERFKHSSGTFLGKTHSIGTKEKIRTFRLGHKDSAETKQNKSKAAKNRPPVTNETKEKISASNKGRPGFFGKQNGFFGKHHTQEQRERKRQEKLNQPKKICPHCQKELGAMSYGRWHGDKCRERN